MHVQRACSCIIIVYSDIVIIKYNIIVLLCANPFCSACMCPNVKRSARTAFNWMLLHLRGGAGRGKAYILNGHIFVNTHQNCTEFSVVVYCVHIELISKFHLICIIYTMITQNSTLTKHAFTEKLRLRKLHEI